MTGFRAMQEMIFLTAEMEMIPFMAEALLMGGMKPAKPTAMTHTSSAGVPVRMLSRTGMI